jgi:AbrB family looped-hinge helix DNA binding protein
MKALGGADMDRVITPSERGQITIPKEIREKLKITTKTKLRIYVNGSKVVLEPVSSLDDLLSGLEAEAREKGLTPEDLDRGIQVVRERLYKSLYGENE